MICAGYPGEIGQGDLSDPERCIHLIDDRGTDRSNRRVEAEAHGSMGIDQQDVIVMRGRIHLAEAAENGIFALIVTIGQVVIHTVNKKST
jgi:hypothetical protein